MKNNVEIYTMALVRVIQESEEYQAFERIKKKLADKPDIKQQINNYRKEAYILQNYGDVSTLYERTEEFQKKYQSFKEDPLAEEYLRCELALCCMLRDISMQITDCVDLELDDIIGEIMALKEQRSDI